MVNTRRKRRSKYFNWRRVREIKRTAIVIIAAIITAVIAVVISQILESDYKFHYPHDEVLDEYKESK